MRKYNYFKQKRYSTKFLDFRGLRTKDESFIKKTIAGAMINNVNAYVKHITEAFTTMK